jgi:hypothetical protein
MYQLVIIKIVFICCVVTRKSHCICHVHQLAIRELKVSDIDGTVESQLSNLWLFNKPCQLEVTTTDTDIQMWHDLTTKKRKEPWKQIPITVFLKTLTFSFTDLHYVKYRQLSIIQGYGWGEGHR